MKNLQQGPLAGLKVFELSHIMAGPTCGLYLADLGADVVKVEKFPGGDDSRRFTPPRIGDESAAFMMLNRNKRGIAVDLKQAGGKMVLRRLLSKADVIIENFRRGTMDRLGLGYSSLCGENPGLIYCEISGFGRTGPYADRGGFDLIAQGMSGLMSITGEGPGRAPIKVGAPLTDITAGILAALGVVAALVHRLGTGQGQRIDTSLFEAGIIHTYWQSAICLATGRPPGPMGSAHPLSAPYQSFQTADGWINIGAANQRNWERLLQVIEAPELGDDPRFRDNDMRLANLPALVEALTRHFKNRSSRDWLDRLQSAGVPAGPVLNIGEMHRDPQCRARRMVRPVEHSRAGTVETIGFPIKFSETSNAMRRGAPVLGEHTREVLREYGYRDDQIDELRRQGAISCAE